MWIQISLIATCAIVALQCDIAFASELTQLNAKARQESDTRVQEFLSQVALASATSGPQRIFVRNGAPTTDYPNVGALLVRNHAGKFEFKCSGVMASCDSFLTAKHCVKSTREYAVFLPHAGFFDAAPGMPDKEHKHKDDDIAVVRLARSVDRVAPASIPQQLTTVGKAGTIVGYGRVGGNEFDYGFKQQGEVQIGTCSADHDGRSEETSVCWKYLREGGERGTNSNTCQGDSGGPLFVGSQLKTAGTTMDGTNLNCVAPDYSYDVRLAKYFEWIKAQSGPTFGAKSCGSGAQVGQVGARYFGISDDLPSAKVIKSHTVTLAKAVKELRLSLNGWVSDGVALKFEVLSPDGAQGCAPSTRYNFSYCRIVNARAGAWTLRASLSAPAEKAQHAKAAVQLVATVLD